MSDKEIAKNNNRPSVQKYSNIISGFQNALQIVDDIVLKNYVSSLSDFDVIPLDKSELESDIKENVQFFKINEMVYEKDEFALYKFSTVFNSLAETKGSIFLIIDSNGFRADFYLGVRSADQKRTISSLKNTLQNALRGQFPGAKTKDYTPEEMQGILDNIKGTSISSVSCVADCKEDKQNKNNEFVQGLEKLVLSMNGQRYTGIIIASTTSQNQLRELRKGYESIYTQLSPFASTQINYGQNSSFGKNQSIAEGSNESITRTISKSDTEGASKTGGESKSHSVSQQSASSKAVKGVLSASLMVGTALAPATGGISLAASGLLCTGASILASTFSKTVSDSTSHSESHSVNNSHTSSESTGTTEGSSHTETYGESMTKGQTDAVTLNAHDKAIEDMLTRIDKQLKRMDECESLGMYDCAAYFLSDDQCTSEMAASTYKALVGGENTGVEVSSINTWGINEKVKTSLILEYVKNFIHPVFKYSGVSGNIEVTPSSMVSGNELSIHMGLPRKSVCGLPVIEHSDFGKEVVIYDGKTPNRGINLGYAYNMGTVCENSIFIDKNSLTMHTFITGSTGSGKSNTIYELLRQCDNLGVKFLVVEPAKGEYKNVFGSRKDVSVYGTNPKLSPLLRINPFSFPDEIHVLEHMDKLIEIFNVCWPMYAAMPAVLKKAVEKSYEKAGWDLVLSENTLGEKIYPTFKDVAKNIKEIIDSSEYDNENKGAYKGSLLTRLESLTNGINGMIFSSNEILGESLFDENVIVDISRVGSTETKSLIMGMLVLKLQEYRVSKADEMNSKLQHVTVLEEAHNILRRTSTDQSQDGANLAGKSVEMVSNVIAEMRTYGEGFIIADQAPGLMDMSVIRNTNTKIIMRLPDQSDRELVGRSANLNEDQITELSKLPRGVAAVYQNEWIDPVLCKVGRYNKEIKNYEYDFNESADLFDKDKQIESSLLDIIMNKSINGRNDKEDLCNLKNAVIESSLETKVKRRFIEYFQDEKDPIDGLRPLIYDFLNAKNAIDASERVLDINEWTRSVVDGLIPSIKIYSNTQIDLAMALITYELSEREPEYRDLFIRFTEVYKDNGRVL